MSYSSPPDSSGSGSGGGVISLGSGDYSLSISSYLPPHADPNSPPASLQIALRLDGSEPSIITSSAGGLQMHELRSPEPAPRPASQSATTASLYSLMNAPSPSLSRLMAFTPSTVDPASSSSTATRPLLWSAVATASPTVARETAAPSAAVASPADPALTGAISALAQPERRFAASFGAELNQQRNGNDQREREFVDAVASLRSVQPQQQLEQPRESNQQQHELSATFSTNRSARPSISERSEEKHLNATQPLYRAQAEQKSEDAQVERRPSFAVAPAPAAATSATPSASAAVETAPSSQSISPARSASQPHVIPPHTSPSLSKILSQREEKEETTEQPQQKEDQKHSRSERPSPRHSRVPSNTQPSLPLSTILSRAEERFARFSQESSQLTSESFADQASIRSSPSSQLGRDTAQTTKTPSFMSSPSPAAVPRVRSEALSGSPVLLGLFPPPRFENRVDEDLAARRLHFRNNHHAADSTSSTSHSLFASSIPPLCSLPLSLPFGSPSREVADLFRRSRGARRAAQQAGCEDLGMGSPTREFALRSLPRESAMRLSHSLEQVDSLPSLSQYVAATDAPAPFAKAAELPQPENLTAAVSAAMNTKATLQLTTMETPATMVLPAPAMMSIPTLPSAALSLPPQQQPQQQISNFTAPTAELNEVDAVEEARRQEAMRNVVERRRRLLEEQQERKQTGNAASTTLPGQPPFISSTAAAAIKTQPVASPVPQQPASAASAVHEQLHSLQRAIAVAPSNTLTAFISKQLYSLEQRLPSQQATTISESEMAEFKQQLSELAELLLSILPHSIEQHRGDPSRALTSSTSATAASTRHSSFSIPPSHSLDHTSTAAPSASTTSTPSSSRPGSVSGEEEYRYRIAQFHAQKARRSPPQQQRELATVKEKSSRASSVVDAASEQHTSAAGSRVQSAQASKQPSRTASQQPSREVSRQPSRAASQQPSREASRATSRAVSAHASRHHSRQPSASESVDGQWEMVEHRDARWNEDAKLRHAISEAPSEAELMNDSNMKPEHHDHPEADRSSNRHNASLTTAASTTFIAPKPSKHHSGRGLNLTTREVRAIVRSEVLGTAKELMAKYSYLPPPKLPIQLTRTQMLRDRARKQLGSPKVPRRVYATAPVVRRNIKSMLTEEMERRAGEWTRGEPEIEEVRWQPQREEEDAAATRRQSCASPQYTVATERKQQRQSQDHDHEDEPQPRMSPPRPSPSTMRELDDLLALPSRLTAAVFSPPRGFAASPPAHRHIDPASFAEMPRTVPRARRDGDLVQWKDDLAREMIEQRSLPGKTQGNDAERPLAHSTSTLLTPFTSDADIDAHLKQLFSGGGQLHVPPPVSEAGSSSHRAATAAIDSPGYSSSFVSSVASSVRGGSDQQRDDQSRVAVLDQIDALQHLSSSAIVFQPPPPQSHSSPHMQQHLELRPVGIILGQTRST